MLYTAMLDSVKTFNFWRTVVVSAPRALWLHLHAHCGCIKINNTTLWLHLHHASTNLHPCLCGCGCIIETEFEVEFGTVFEFCSFGGSWFEVFLKKSFSDRVLERRKAMHIIMSAIFVTFSRGGRAPFCFGNRSWNFWFLDVAMKTSSRTS